MSNNIHAVVLAAGASERFGSDKRLYVVDSLPMLQRAVAAVIDSVHSVQVILKTSDAGQLPLLLGQFSSNAAVLPVLLDEPERGMGSNLARAVAQLPADCEAVLVLLADLPYLQRETVQAVVAAYRAESIVVPVYSEGGHSRRGHPVLFDRVFFPLLQQLQGDSGARSVLQVQSESLLLLSVTDPGVLLDVDVLPP